MYPPSATFAEKPLEEFESREVESAYRNCEERRPAGCVDLCRGIFLAFEEGEDLPNEREAKVILDLAEEFGLEGPRVTKFKYVTIWSFDWPYWRFDEKGEAVCNELNKRTAGRWEKHCESKTLIWVWSD